MSDEEDILSVIAFSWSEDDTRAEKSELGETADEISDIEDFMEGEDWLVVDEVGESESETHEKDDDESASHFDGFEVTVNKDEWTRTVKVARLKSDIRLGNHTGTLKKATWRS